MVVVTMSADVVPPVAHRHVHGTWGFDRPQASWRPSVPVDLEARAKNVFDKWSSGSPGKAAAASQELGGEGADGGEERRLTKSQAKNAFIALLGSDPHPFPPTDSPPKPLLLITISVSPICRSIDL
jgi:hypothetical protein